jgi:hypothetical protein
MCASCGSCGGGNDGTIRAKALGRHGLEKRVRAAIGLTVAMQAMSVKGANSRGTCQAAAR